MWLLCGCVVILLCVFVEMCGNVCGNVWNGVVFVRFDCVCEYCDE